jgi:Protein of unknown function (DUF732)
MPNRTALSRLVGAVAVAVGMSIAAVPLTAAPVHADMADDAFIAALNAAGVRYENATVAKALARGVCPQVKQGGKSLAWVISGMMTSGIPRKMATTMAGEAVRAYCPDMIKSVLP